MNDVMYVLMNDLAFLGPIGWPELLIILIIALLIFGSRLPQVMRSMGRSLNEFKAGMSEVTESIDLDEPATKETPSKESPSKESPSKESPSKEADGSKTD